MTIAAEKEETQTIPLSSVVCSSMGVTWDVNKDSGATQARISKEEWHRLKKMFNEGLLHSFDLLQ